MKQRENIRVEQAQHPGRTPPFAAGSGSGSGSGPDDSAGLGGGAGPDHGSSGKSGGKLPLIGAALAALVAIAIVFSDSLPLLGGTADQVSAQEAQTLEQQFQTAQAALLAGSASMITPISPADLADPQQQEKIKAALQLDSAAEKEQLIQQAVRNTVQLGWITVWDNYAEDGDVIEIVANGVTQRVPIWNAPTTVVIPYSGPGAQVTIRGVVDGGGGITAAAETSQGGMPFPPLAVGQTRNLTIR